MSCISNSGDNLNAATAIEGSINSFLFFPLMEVFDRIEGLHAGISSMTNILFSAFQYEYIVDSTISS